jgi:two-component system, cell cycle response regulator DivK
MTSKDANKVILIVDDYEDDRRLVRKILEKDSFVVEEASGWKEAIFLIKTKKIDLVLLDLRMPDLSGYELLGVIRREKDNKELPVIVYSSAPKNEDEVSLYKPDGFVSKYSSPKELVSQIKKIFSVQ